MTRSGGWGSHTHTMIQSTGMSSASGSRSSSKRAVTPSLNDKCHVAFGAPGIRKAQACIPGYCEVAELCTRVREAKREECICGEETVDIFPQQITAAKKQTPQHTAMAACTNTCAAPTWQACPVGLYSCEHCSAHTAAALALIGMQSGQPRSGQYSGGVPALELS